MKKIILALLFSALIVSAAWAWGGAFCDGYQEGYKAGHCYGQYSCLAPLAPLCPLPRLGEDTYQDGYNRGFLAGLNSR